jgi:hypothetical protein
MPCSSTAYMQQPPNPALRQQGEILLQRAGLYEVMQHVSQIDRAVSQGHRLLRQNDRAAALNLDVGQATQQQAELQFALARRHIAGALGSLGQFRQSTEWQELVAAYDQRRGTPEAGTALAEARQHWVGIIHGSDLAGPDAAEAVAAWDTAASRLQNDGVTGVYDLLDEQLAEYGQVLNADADWGGRPHSPLAWWQWLLVILVVGVAVAALVACLIWSACTWIMAVYCGICAFATAGDWVFSICLTVAC